MADCLQYHGRLAVISRQHSFGELTVGDFLARLQPFEAMSLQLVDCDFMATWLGPRGWLAAISRPLGSKLEAGWSWFHNRLVANSQLISWSLDSRELTLATISWLDHLALWFCLPSSPLHEKKNQIVAENKFQRACNHFNFTIIPWTYAIAILLPRLLTGWHKLLGVFFVGVHVYV